MMRKLRRVLLVLLRVTLVCLVTSVLIFLLTTPSQQDRGAVVATHDPFPWEETRKDDDVIEFKGPKRNLQKAALINDDIFTLDQSQLSTTHHIHQRSKYNYTVVQHVRQQALDTSCREQTIMRESWQDLSLSQQNAVAQRIMVNDDYKLIYCPVPLTAIGPWLKVMYLLGPGSNLHNIDDVPSKELNNKDNFVYLSSFTPEEQEEKLATYLKFVVTRHPFMRLVAAYKMKFESDNAFFHERYGREIVRLYRSGASEQETGSDVTFSEYIEYLLHLEAKDEMNEHWRPIQSLCQPCQIGYDYILHYETLNTDSTELLQELELQSMIPILPRDTWDDITTQYLHSLFQQITPAWIGKLVQKYQEDFTMFTYGSIF